MATTTAPHHDANSTTAILTALNIDPFSLFFFAPPFVHPALRLADPYSYIPDNHIPLALTLSLTSFLLLTFTCAARLLGRIHILRVFGTEDAAILAAWACNAGTLSVYLWGISHAGLGRHLYDLQTPQIHALFVVQYAVIWPSTIAATLTRLSILTWLQSVLPCTERRVRYTILLLHAVNLCLCVFAIAPVVLQCLPYTWAAWVFPFASECRRKGVSSGRRLARCSVAAAALATVLDCAILAVPLRLIWSLRVPRTRRLAVSAIFAIGAGTCVTALVRAYFIDRSFNHPAHLDLSWGMTVTVAIVQVENAIGMLAACGPHIKAAVARWRNGGGGGAVKSPLRGTVRSGSEDAGGGGLEAGALGVGGASARLGKNEFEMDVPAGAGESRLNLTGSAAVGAADEEMGMGMARGGERMSGETAATGETRVRTAEGAAAVSVLESR